MKKKFPHLGVRAHAALIDTLTRPRLTRYLSETRNDEHQALRLYMLNAHISAALWTDLHFVEIALRNKFDDALTRLYGASNWYDDPRFRGVLQKTTLENVDKAIEKASKRLAPGQPLPPGKVVAELTFGFWQMLTNKRYIQHFWAPAFQHVLTKQPPPAAKAVHNQLETLVYLRNRIAHHEPIIHLDLAYRHRLIIELAGLLCDSTPALLRATSTFRRELAALKKFRRRKKL